MGLEVGELTTLVGVGNRVGALDVGNCVGLKVSYSYSYSSVGEDVGVIVTVVEGAPVAVVGAEVVGLVGEPVVGRWVGEVGAVEAPGDEVVVVGAPDVVGD